MAFISESKKEELRRRADIVEIVQAHTRLKKRGRLWVGLCPFHQEKTPSFTVYPDHQIFKCFGCQKGGDVFRFVQDTQGLDFPGALEHLAERCGVELEWQAGAGRPKGFREELFRYNEMALDYFRRMLQSEEEGRAAREYLQSRDVSREMIEGFRLGWAPDSWEGLLGELRRRKLDPDRGAHVGLLGKKTSGGYYDRFRGRLIFPIRSTAGKTIGFCGRVLSDEKTAKYINSSESEIFHKGSIFYGIDQAMDGIRKKGRVILCEGNLDVIMLHQFGFVESLASLGTALTKDHLSRLVRLSSNIILLFDADEAGRKAMKRSLELFLPQDVQPRCVVLPPGDDPDTFLRRQGAEAMEERIGRAPSLIDFVVEDAFSGRRDDAEGTAAAVDELAPLLAGIGNAVLRDLWIKKVAERTGVEERALRQRVFHRTRPYPERAPAKTKGGEEVRIAENAEVAETGMIRLLLNYPRFSTDFVDDGVAELFMDPSLKTLAQDICQRALASQDEAEFNLASLIGGIQDEGLRDLVAGWAVDRGGVGEKDAPRNYKDYFQKLKRQSTIRRLKAEEGHLRAALGSGDKMQVREVMRRMQELRNRLAPKAPTHKTSIEETL